MKDTRRKAHRVALATASSLFLFAGLGCAPRYAALPPPPPGAQLSPLIELANHNGLETGRSDGARDVEHGLPPHPQTTRAYHDTPGYDPHLGPFGPYRDVFRNAYLSGYDKGYHHR